VAAFSNLALASPGRALVTTTLASPGIDRVLHQIGALHNDLLHRRPTSDDVRMAAGYLRQIVAYRQNTGRDIELSRAFRGLVAAHGREALTTLEPDPAILRRGLDLYGIDAPALSLRFSVPDERAVVLDTLVRRGAAQYYFDPLVFLETVAVMLEEDPSICPILRQMIEATELLASLLCAAAAFLPLMAPECATATAIVVLLQVLERIWQC
jgi:hypothetical protein